MHFWQGEIISDEILRKNIDSLNSHILDGHTCRFNLDEFLRACDRFAHRLLSEEKLHRELQHILVTSGEANVEDAETALKEITDFMNEHALRAKLSAEFGSDNPFRSQKVDKGLPIFESWFPLGFIVQFLASNSPSLAVLSAFEGLLTGNINFIKLSKDSSDFTIRFFEEFFKDKIANSWKKLLIVAKISSKEKNLLAQVTAEADGVVAWGSEEAVAEIRKLAPPRARMIEWGHRISFSYVTKKKQATSEIFDKIARDVFLFDQQSCSSPQCLFVEDANFRDLENFADKLAAAFKKLSLTEKLSQPNDLESAEITRAVLLNEIESSLHKNFTAVRKDKNWRILIDSRPGLRASPLYRSIWLKPLSRDHILAQLRPLSAYLQTLGLSCERDELFDLTQSFYKAGVTRIRPLGEMLASYSGEPHDGVAALTRYMKKVSVEQYCGVDQYATLDDLRGNEIHLPTGAVKVMTKEDFQNMAPPAGSAELYFKSGGSSGEPKISVFTYQDYHRQMKYAADGLLAAGIEPARDKCINLFFSGGLYGSFLSIFSVLEDLKVVQFPMTAHMDFDFVADMIVQHKVNVLMGMPSYLMQLFEAKAALFKKNPVVEKIFFGGETFSKKQIEKLGSDFGIRHIISATYGSVDMGPLGYQCASSEAGVHHLHQYLHKLEILELDEDKPVKAGQPGRLVFSSYGRQGLNLLRYDIGDLGAWVDEPCGCGRLAPRFRLMGRTGDIFRMGGNFLNYNKFAQILANELSYAFEMQIELDEDKLTLVLDAKTDRNMTARESILKNYQELNELVTIEKSMTFDVDFRDQLKRSPASGKLLRIIDHRGN